MLIKMISSLLADREISAFEFWELFELYQATMKRTGISCKKIPRYIRDSAWRWRIVEN